MNLKPDFTVPKFLIELKEELISMEISGAISGGACRDSIFGKEVADIDIFTWSTKSIPNILKNTKFYGFSIPPTKNYESSSFQVILNAFWKNYKVQFILIEPKENYLDIVKDFPISVSQVCLPILPFTPYIATELFYKSIENHIIYYKETGELSNTKYINKISDKYSPENGYLWELIEENYSEEQWFNPPKLKIKKIQPFPMKKYKVINISPPIYREFNA